MLKEMGFINGLIAMPSQTLIKPLSERTLEEKLDILKLLFMEEAQRVKKPGRNDCAPASAAKIPDPALALGQCCGSTV